MKSIKSLVILTFVFFLQLSPIQAESKNQKMILSPQSSLIFKDDNFQLLGDYGKTKKCNGNATIKDSWGATYSAPYILYINIAYNPNSGSITAMGWDTERVNVDYFGIGTSYDIVNAMVKGYPYKSGGTAYFKPFVVCYSIGAEGGEFASGNGGVWSISTPGPWMVE